MPYKKGDGSLQFVGTGSTSFDGSNDYVSVADSNDFSFGDSSTDSAFSISAWVKMDDATNFAIASKGIYNSTGEWNFKTIGSDKLYLYLYDDSVSSTYEAAYYNTALTSFEGQWIHLCCTYVGTGGTSANDGIKLYLNGSLVADVDDGNGTYVAMENQAVDVHIGRYDSNYADGSIKNVAIWSRALTATEVQNVMYKTYAEVSGRLASGLVSWWGLDGEVGSDGNAGSGYILSEVAGAGSTTNLGTISGATVDTDLYGGDTPVIPRAIDNAPTVQADAIGAGSADFSDATTDHISIPHNSVFDVAGVGDSITVAAWVKTPTHTYNAIVTKRDPDSPTTETNWALGTGDSGQAGIYYHDGGGWLTNYNGAEIDDGDWHHVVGILKQTASDNVNSKIYVDGVLSNSTDHGDNDLVANTHDVHIGNFGADGDPWIGNICQVGIWSAVLTQAQIQSIMEKTYAEFTASEKTDLVSYWALDEVAGDTIPYGNYHIPDLNDTTLGSEVVVSGDFSSSSGWTLSGSPEPSIDTSAGTCTFSANDSYIYQESLTSGLTYKIVITVDSWGGGKILIRSGGATYLNSPSGSASSGEYTYYITAINNVIRVEVAEFSGGESIVISNLSYKPVNGNYGKLI